MSTVGRHQPSGTVQLLLLLRVNLIDQKVSRDEQIRFTITSLIAADFNRFYLNCNRRAWHSTFECVVLYYCAPVLCAKFTADG